MDIIVEIRRRHAVQKQSISAIAREMGLSRPTVRKHLTTVAEPSYERVQPVSPKLGQFVDQLTQWLVEFGWYPNQPLKLIRECGEIVGLGLLALRHPRSGPTPSTD